MKFKKILTFVLAIILSITSILPVYAREEGNAWTYTIGVNALRNDGEPSMINTDNFFNKRATIVEKKGVYTCTISFRSKMGLLPADISSLKIIKNNETIEIAKEEGSEEYPQQYTFDIKKDEEKILVEVEVPRSPMDKVGFYLKFNWNDKQDKIQIEEDDKEVIENEYEVPVVLIKEKGDSLSMANRAIISPAIVKIKNGKAIVELQTQSIKILEIKGELTKLKNLDTDKIAKKEGETFIFEVPISVISETTLVNVELTTNAMSNKPRARLKFEAKSNVGEDIVETINKDKLRKEIYIAGQIEKGNKTDLAYNDLKNQIRLAENIYNNSKSQEDIDIAVENLKIAIKDFNLSKDEDINSKYNGKEFRIPVVLLKENANTLSMASGAIVSPSLVKVENGKAIVELQTQSINFLGITGRLESLRILSGGRYIRQSGSTFVFEAPIDIVERQVDILVEMETNAMPNAQRARLRFNGSGSYSVDNSKSSKTLLLEAINNAEKLLEKDFTKDSWNRLISELNKAKDVYNDKYANEDKINEASKNLNDAINKLVKNPNNNKSGKVESTFKVPVSLHKVGGGKSMAEAALVSIAKVEKEKDGSYKYYVEFKSINKEFGGKMLNGNLTKLFYYDGSKKEASNEGGGLWTFKLASKVDEIKVAIWVDVMDQIMGGKAGAGEQEAILKFDWSKAEEEVNKVNKNHTNFSDIVGHWAKEAIDYVTEKGYFKGIGNNKFAPERAITRGEFVTVLGRMQKVDKSKYSNNKFKDVKNNKFYTEYVNWASELGIIKGVGNSEFRPNDILTREQMAVITSNYSDKFKINSKTRNENIKFKDDRNISTWAKDSVEKISKLGIISGMEDGNFSPKKEFTRAQVAQILFNMEK